MLVISRLFRRTRDDRGAVLVAVVGVMLVGFIAVAVIASAVMVTIQSNSRNRDRTQAFVAAESGRDAALGTLADGCVTGDLEGSGTEPTFAYTVHITDGEQPTSADSLPSDECPDEDTRYVVIRSTGSGPGGSTTTVDAVYPWTVTYSDVPGGVVTYFAGGFSAGVSHYTGDLVLRDGNWSCTNGATLTGDLYVIDGTVSLSNDCTINGDIYAKGAVTSNSLNWHINARPPSAGSSTGSAGKIVSDAFVRFNANGNPTIAGGIHARGNVDLEAGGGGTATIGGPVVSMATATVNPVWTVPPAAGVVPTTSGSMTPPPFDPTLEWLRAATQWIDLDGASAWGTKTAVNCALVHPSAGPTNPSLYVKTQLSTAGAPLVLDFTACSRDVKLDLTSLTVARDAVILVPPAQRLEVALGGISDDGGKRQVFFVHADASRNHVGGEPVPTCGNSNQNDKFDTGAVDGNLRIMIYSPCGLTGTITSGFAGQLYTNSTTNLHGDAAYTCKSMEWPNALPKLGCTIKGEGGIADESTVLEQLGGLLYQTER